MHQNNCYTSLIELMETEGVYPDRGDKNPCVAKFSISVGKF